jgi:two-component system cell cycle sensor histidine kinase PleC
VRDPFIVLDADLRVLSVNNAFYKVFQVRSDETIGKFIYDLGNRQWNIPKLQKLLEEILSDNASFDDYIVEHDFPNIGKRTMILNARRIPRLSTKPKKMLLSITDITEINRIKLIIERMFEKEIFSELVRKESKEIDELKKEVNALLSRLGEKFKYKNGAK